MELHFTAFFFCV